MDDRDEPTPWEEINPPMVSAQRPAQLSVCSARLEPATSDQFRNELTACLALVAPVGMTEEARREWLAVAWETLKHLPNDMLAAGCRKARELADHPAKIVPIITAETREWMDLRRNARASTFEPQPMPALPEPERCTPEQAAAILEEFGLKSRFASSRHPPHPAAGGG